jgi:hypothetical protein
MYMEVTGPLCSGKSSSLSTRGQTIGAMYAPLGFVYLAFTQRAAFWFLLLKVFNSDRSMLHISRVGAHVFAKFGFRVFTKHSGHSCMIDEGISHIPFILMLEKDEINRFVDLFASYLRDSKIVFLRVDEAILRARLKRRGHKRIRTSNDFENFTANHLRVMEEYWSALVSRDFDLVDGL